MMRNFLNSNQESNTINVLTDSGGLGIDDNENGLLAVPPVISGPVRIFRHNWHLIYPAPTVGTGTTRTR
jgi:hypothetical protein